MPTDASKRLVQAPAVTTSLSQEKTPCSVLTVTPLPGMARVEAAYGALGKNLGSIAASQSNM